jgi:hypothetical protein
MINVFENRKSEYSESIIGITERQYWLSKERLGERRGSRKTNGERLIVNDLLREVVLGESCMKLLQQD